MELDVLNFLSGNRRHHHHHPTGKPTHNFDVFSYTACQVICCVIPESIWCKYILRNVKDGYALQHPLQLSLNFLHFFRLFIRNRYELVALYVDSLISIQLLK